MRIHKTHTLYFVSAALNLTKGFVSFVIVNMMYVRRKYKFVF